MSTLLNPNRISSILEDTGRPAPAPARELLDDLVAANRILFDQRVLDAFGHVSVRHDQDPERFLLARNMAPGLVTHDDIIEFNLDGAPVDAGGRSVYLERFIHGEIYRSRPDVMAVVHSHSACITLFSVLQDVRLRPLCHMCGFLGNGAPVFEIRDVAGDGTDLLISSNELGRSLVGSLGEGSFVLMRGHGATTTGPSLKHAVYRAIYAEVNANLQRDALRIGDVTYLSPAEALTAQQNVETQIERPWGLWKARVMP